ncbi:MAG: YdcF family protein [Acidobacteria bacterium]|nr:YdcF family protein [Acidobacteriota bacterium]
MRKIRIFFIFIMLPGLLWGLFSGRFLVVNDPQAADVILVLAGETEQRPALALSLLRKGYAPKLVLDVPAAAQLYQWPQTELARRYLQELPEAAALSVCPIAGLSTRDESDDAARCLAQMGGKKVLIVTSDYHTRRSLSIFRKTQPGFTYSVAAAHDASAFGVNWWQHREWAKTNFNEWTKFLWWEAVDRWR